MTPKAIEYFKALNPMEREGLCAIVGIKPTWLRNLVWGGRTCSVSLAVRFEKATRGKVKAIDIRPDIDWDLVYGKRKIQDQSSWVCTQ